ncbi:AraC-type DNA-binding protein [Actinopolymorpha cephalotaxi]|uniref:AraC-like DNA-binding protein/mannose-6-phosphate isomerase-like protein (Cupin superfamily) n=1 Tax=Actinopolymorpha cephalotaxi TaxID=504797 RepID=A0A1I2M313_9ACTN|nr:AraC family transcriptional regulator [Actinopolymorpha cephalotaxi]NYH81537.1 AraC-like DNA-binding protein/mannose-6-phosphate isomerase-like protein (cupin superfamily) [Actinopolymorpha cephalotaxi]SFF85240.1 AraC-type DNA-binding protein [Actinopolymorpha cephalotaxi]
MAHPSVRTSPGRSSRLRTMRSDGTPVYRYELRPGVPPVSVECFDAEGAHVGVPPAHRHAHDFLVLVYVEEGEGSFSVDGTDLPLRPGQVHAVPPGRVIDISAVIALTRCRAWSVAFTPDAVPALAAVSPLAWSTHPLLAMFAPDAGHGLVAEPDRARWSEWLAELSDELADPHRLGAGEVVAGLLTRVLVAAARLAPPASVGAPDPLVEQVFHQIEATFRDPVSAADIARALGYTPGHLTTVVRERTGRPLLEWVTERRMTEVRRMLRETDLPLGVVAARTGLRDATYLVRRFRDRYGITPERWRRSQRAG